MFSGNRMMATQDESLEVRDERGTGALRLRENGDQLLPADSRSRGPFVERIHSMGYHPVADARGRFFVL